MSLDRPMFWVNGKQSTSVDVMDRGLAYGDGLFETLRWSGDQCIDLDAHLQRMRTGMLRLIFDQPDALLAQMRVELNQFIREVLQHDMPCTLKLIITRGSGGRGYGLPIEVNPVRIIMCLPLHEKPASFYDQGIDITSSRYRLGHAPSIAGIKHLSRLDQVMARASLDKPDAIEGLVADLDDNLVEGVACNVFLLTENVLVTPSLDLCGIDGIVRQNVIESAKELQIPIQIAKIPMVSVSKYRAMFLTNSLIGIMPVKSWADCHFDPFHPMLKTLQLKINHSMKIKP